MQDLDIFPALMFSPARSIAVWEETWAYLSEGTQLAAIEAAVGAFFPTWKLVPVPSDTLLSGHTFPWQESYHDFQVAFTLAGFGLYKQAHGSLRSAVEQGLLSIYWNIDNDGGSAHSLLAQISRANSLLSSCAGIESRSMTILFAFRPFTIFVEISTVSAAFTIMYTRRVQNTRMHCRFQRMASLGLRSSGSRRRPLVPGLTTF